MTNRPGPLAQQIAAELRAELGRQNHSKRWLADQVGISHVTVTRWVNGEGGMTFDALDAICQALGMSIADLLAAVARNGQSVPAPRPPRTRRSAAAPATGRAADTQKTARRNSHRFDDNLVAA